MRDPRLKTIFTQSISTQRDSYVLFFSRNRQLSEGDDLQMQYSPSMWANRLTPETIVQNHVENVSFKNNDPF